MPCSSQSTASLFVNCERGATKAATALRETVASCVCVHSAARTYLPICIKETIRRGERLEDAKRREKQAWGNIVGFWKGRRGRACGEEWKNAINGKKEFHDEGD